MKLWPFGRRKEAADSATPATALPVPTHLQPFFVPHMKKRDQTQITGDVRCTCGGERFAAHRMKDSSQRYHLTCIACGKEVLLFDEKQHGWDTVVCHMNCGDDSEEEITERCGKCGGEGFGATVWVEPTEKEEFVACVEGELPDDEWVNAFTWFAAHLTCCSCGARIRGWADVETA